MICSSCKYHNQESAKFCENCGHRLEVTNPVAIQKKRKKKKNKMAASKEMQQTEMVKKLFTTKSLWIIATVVIGAFLIISIISSNESRKTTSDVRVVDQKSMNPLVEAKVFEIAAKFVCGCGGCDEDPLEHCKCNYAIAQREFIRNRLENSESEEAIVAAVIAKYGGLKDENSQAIKDAAKNIATDIKIARSKDNILATYSDLTLIYNSFECPCGQCGIKELAECTCNHKRGAIEVKKFIDVQIAKNKFTVEQVIEKVAEVYGGKKI